jgi:hypothetical protein
MPIPLSCEQCGRNLRVKDELAGMQIYCPDCKGVLTVPHSDDPFRPEPEPPLEVVAAEPPKEDPYAERYREPASKKPRLPRLDDDEWDDAPPPKRIAPTRPAGNSVGAVFGGMGLAALGVIIFIFGIATGFFVVIKLAVILFIAGIITFCKGLFARN